MKYLLITAVLFLTINSVFADTKQKKRNINKIKPVAVMSYKSVSDIYISRGYDRIQCEKE